MNLIEGRAVSNNHTFLQKLGLADGHRANRVNGFDTLFDFFLKFSIEQSMLYIRIGVLCREGDDDVAGSATHVLLDRGLNTLLRDDQRLHSNEVTVGGDHINNIVNLSTVSTNLTASVVGLMMMTDEGGYGVLPHTFGHTESHDNMHL